MHHLKGGTMASIRKHVTRDVVTLDAGAPIRDAARLMSERKIGSVAVREDGKVVGLVTERDLVMIALARDGNGAMPIREAMRPSVPRVSVDANEAECAALMRDNTTRHLLVEEGGRVVGLVSMRDIIQLMLDEKQFLIDQLQTYIGGR
jgi:CBS domain-containing protein